ncbi:LCP family glycopolymer transferase [Lachnospiraceae bacterium LCP25S3_G4]
MGRDVREPQRSRKDGNPAKSYAGGKKNKKLKMSKRIGMMIVALQAVMTVIFSGLLFYLNILPMKFIVPIVAVLVLILVIILSIQLKAKGKGITSKIISILISIVLVFGSFYVYKGHSALKKVTGGAYKTEAMVVAVKAEDSAESIKDAKAYSFGVQYAMGKEDVDETVEEINGKVGTQINTVEYSDLNEAANALLDGSVEAIIYNSAYAGVLDESIEGFNQKVKIIYTHDIKKKVDNAAQKVEVKKDTFSIFISGIDVYGNITTNSRSDVNIIATINPTTHQVLLITTPRDYYVDIPGVTDGNIKDKLTHAGIYGVDASMRTLGQLYDMSVPFYARVNFTSLVEIVDAFGGVDVYSEYAFTTSEDTQLVMNVNQGMNTFNGKQALAFSRERQNIEGGDNQRGKNQQAVIKGLINKAISPALLGSMNGIIDSVSGNFETNMSSEQIQNLLKQQLADGSSWNIYSVAAEGTGDTQYCFSYSGAPLYVMQPDQASVDNIKSLVDQVENGEVLPTE